MLRARCRSVVAWPPARRQCFGTVGRARRAAKSPARRPRCGAPRLRATRRRAAAALLRFLRARSFRSEARAHPVVCLPADGVLGPPYRLNGHARRLSRAPRGTPHHGRRAARGGGDVHSAWQLARFLLLAYARRLGGRRCASRRGRQAAGVPGAPGWRAGKRPAGRHAPPVPVIASPKAARPQGFSAAELRPPPRPRSEARRRPIRRRRECE
jgi:hypothetical protein